MKAYNNSQKGRPSISPKFKTKNSQKAKWSRELLHNAMRTFKKSARQESKLEILKELNYI